MQLDKDLIRIAHGVEKLTWENGALTEDLKKLTAENKLLRGALETIRDRSSHCDIYDLKSIAIEALHWQEVEV